MGRMITLKNGGSVPIIDFNDVIELVKDTLGDDLSECIATEIEEWEDEVDYYRSELDYSNNKRTEYVNAMFHAQNDIESIIKELKEKDENKELSHCIDKIEQVLILLEDT